MFEGISDPDHLEAGHRFAVMLLTIPHVQLHLEVLEFRRTFAESVSRVSTGLRRKADGVLHVMLTHTSALLLYTYHYSCITVAICRSTLSCGHEDLSKYEMFVYMFRCPAASKLALLHGPAA